jgi:hypothetical protein
MIFHVHRHYTDLLAVFFNNEMKWLPTGSAGGAAAFFQRAQEFVRDERVERNAGGIRAPVPVRSGDLADALQYSGSSGDQHSTSADRLNIPEAIGSRRCALQP